VGEANRVAAWMTRQMGEATEDWMARVHKAQKRRRVEDAELRGIVKDPKRVLFSQPVPSAGTSGRVRGKTVVTKASAAEYQKGLERRALRRTKKEAGR
jgi:hypothetical protein